MWTRKFWYVLMGLSILAAMAAPPVAGTPPQENPQLQRERQLVRDVQQALQQRGYDPGQLDGIVGSQTRTALRSFQQAEGLEVSGRMSSETLERLGVEVPDRGQGDSPGRDGLVGTVASAGKKAGEAVGDAAVVAGRSTAKGATTAAAAAATGATAAAQGTSKGATAAAQGTSKGATAAAQGTSKGATATAQGASKGATATAQGAATSAEAVAEGTTESAKAVARGTGRVASGTKNLLFGKDEDDKIRDRVVNAFKKDRSIDPSHIDVSVQDGVVTLTLKAGTDEEWNRAVVVARRVDGVQRVFVRRP